jgi:uncharacterized protein (DUF58 family)
MTRFPFGLVQARIKIHAVDSLIVCPRLGRLTRAWKQTVEAERAGSQRSQRRQGSVEGDFFGLREYRPGDSRRWIHWRTSAKVRDLTVRQFEQQRNRDVVFILDLWQAPRPTPEQSETLEIAVSFAATAVADICRGSHSRLTVAIAGVQSQQWTAPASTLFMSEVLEQMAVVKGGDGKGLSNLLADVLRTAPQGTRLIVISTRPSEFDHVIHSKPFTDDRSIQGRLARVTWIDVSGPDLPRLFQL